MVLSPCPDRLARVQDTIAQALREDHLDPDVAHKLAGKLNFITASVFGHCGRALLRPVYGRAHETFGKSDGSHHWNSALRAALASLRKILDNVQPRTLPLSIHQPIAIVYTDAFFTPVVHSAPLNGWGFVVRIDDQVFYAHGSVPQFVIDKYCRSKAFIYFLEMVAHLIPLLVLRALAPQLVIAYVDNQAGLQALKKGYGKQPTTNCFIAVLTRIVCELQYLTHYEWVPSEQNISDPISRADFTLAHLHGWTHVPCDLNS